jgi:hypothetical protein
MCTSGGYAVKSVNGAKRSPCAHALLNRSANSMCLPESKSGIRSSAASHQAATSRKRTVRPAVTSAGALARTRGARTPAAVVSPCATF